MNLINSCTIDLEKEGYVLNISFSLGKCISYLETEEGVYLLTLSVADQDGNRVVLSTEEVELDTIVCCPDCNKTLAIFSVDYVTQWPNSARRQGDVLIAEHICNEEPSEDWSNYVAKPSNVKRRR